MSNVIFQFAVLIVFDAIFVLLCCCVLIALAMRAPAAFAVLRRNFVSYFSTPNGYVFLCLFVLLGSFAAFWPYEFFNANLANLYQLNFWFPFIMLGFIPAITMSIWSEERHQGTDELLLTVPATDLDIVAGKYLAAVAIFTVSLLFSQICNFMILFWLSMGDLDVGLFVGTYWGYWLIGLTMLSVGMVASFLTGNLTVGFILGVVFNAPFVFAQYADVVIPTSGAARVVTDASIAGRFADFGRGVVSLSSIAYFVMIAVIGLYLSVVLIGRRHWLGGRDGHSMLWHYLGRAASLIVLCGAAVVFFSAHDWIRADMTSERINSISPETRAMLKSIKPEQTIKVEAFISRDIPPELVKTKFDLISMLGEMKQTAGNKLDVRVYNNLDPTGEAADLAEQQYNIVPRQVLSVQQGMMRQQQVLLGVAFTCGLEKVVVPYLAPGMPVEYELIRSIKTAAEPKRKRLGVVSASPMFGDVAFDGPMPRPIPKQRIITELEQQFEVIEVNAAEPIEEQKYDVLMVVQPSALTLDQFDNVLAAIARGMPTAVFEDPFPISMGDVAGTTQPRAPRQGMMGFQEPSEPKPDINRLWKLLGVQPEGKVRPDGALDAEVVWQKYNPYPKARELGITGEWVFADAEAPGAEQPLNNQEAITSGLYQILFPYPGGVSSTGDEKMEFIKLVTTGDQTGLISAPDVEETMQTAQRTATSPDQVEAMFDQRRERIEKEFCLAAYIREKIDPKEAEARLKEAESASGSAKETPEKPAEPKSGTDGADAAEEVSKPIPPRPIQVVYVADIDLLHGFFLELRERVNTDIEFRFDNVTFVLNAIDTLAGEEELVAVRKRQPKRSTLQLIEEATAQAQEEADRENETYLEKNEQLRKEIEKQRDDNLAQLEKKLAEINPQEQIKQNGEVVISNEMLSAAQRLVMRQEVLRRRASAELERLDRERQQSRKAIQRQLTDEIDTVQKTAKFWAVFVPPIPPLILAMVVFLYRRRLERAGISKQRRR